MSLPSPQPKFMPYLSIIPRRRPTQKTHANIGHAKNAVVAKFGYNVHGASCDMQIFEYKDDGWQLLYDIKKGDLEPPWRKGEIEEAARKKQEAVQRATDSARVRAAGMAKELLKKAEVYEAVPFTSAQRKLFVDGYVEGYMARRSEHKPSKKNYS